MQPNVLTNADSHVLAQVFDPESALAKVEVLVDPALPADRHVRNDELLKALKMREKTAIALIERYETSRSRSTSSKEDAFECAMAILDPLLAEYPDYASARNNRAQLRRWRYGDRNLLCQPFAGSDRVASSAAQAILADLKTAIALASPNRPTDAVSPAQGRLLAQAYTQLAAIFYAVAKDFSSAENCHIVVEGFQEWNKESFEDEASRLFYLGGLYGNEVAKALAVHTNPHAKLCGSIVKEAMQKEFAQA